MTAEPTDPQEPASRDPHESIELWIKELAHHLEVDGVEIDIDAVLALAGQAAHTVVRPAAPVTTYLIGYVAGLAEALRQISATGAADLIITSGGTAHSRADALRPALQMLGAELEVDSVDMRPGHPVLLARLPRREGPLYLLGLPGNPLAGFSALSALGVPLLRALRGIDHGSRTPTLRRTAGAQLSGARRGTRLLPVRRGAQGVIPAGHSRSHMMRGLAEADALAIVPAAGIAPGEPVDCLPVPGQHQEGSAWDV